MNFIVFNYAITLNRSRLKIVGKFNRCRIYTAEIMQHDLPQTDIMWK